MIGAGRERRSTWIDLVCNDSAGFEKYYAAAETYLKKNGARPHLGKYCESIDRSDLERLHQEYFVKFNQLVESTTRRENLPMRSRADYGIVQIPRMWGYSDMPAETSLHAPKRTF